VSDKAMQRLDQMNREIDRTADFFDNRGTPRESIELRDFVVIEG
jgi:hypothetical protein